MSEPRDERERTGERDDAPSEDATADIEEQQGDDGCEQGRPAEDAPAY
jgi:hypothetical protein